LQLRKHFALDDLVTRCFEFFNFARARVYRVATRHQDPETSKDVSKIAPRKIHIIARLVRTCKVIIRVQKPIKKDSGTPITTLGSKLKGILRINGLDCQGKCHEQVLHLENPINVGICDKEKDS
jgi:hypothetical protein